MYAFLPSTATFLFITGILWWPRGAIVKFENKNEKNKNENENQKQKQKRK